MSKDSFSIVEADGLKGAKYAVKKEVRGFFYSNNLWMVTNVHGLPAGYTENCGDAFWGTKEQAEKLLKLEAD